ncbi:MAG: hypothetical protein ACRDYB_14500 [Acidimicrobiales bacterium]
MGMHPWILKQLVDSRQADIERRARRAARPERVPTTAILRRVGSAVVEIGRRTTKRSAGTKAPADPRVDLGVAERQAA